MPSYPLLWLLFSILAAGLFWFLWFRRREKLLLNRLQKMVDQASRGCLERQEISESRFSALENSLKRCLEDSLLSESDHKSQKSAIQRLISDIAHQTLTPVSNLKLYAELLEENSGSCREEIQTIKEQTEKLDFLIQSLVKLSRMESGIISVTPRPTPVSLLFQAVWQEYEKKSEEKEIRLLIPDTELSACFDLKWTSEALGNIVDNSIKYTEPGGTVSLHAEAYSFYLRIDVADTGIGIAREDISQIFSRFYRSPQTASLPGVGIGLYLAREILQAQKGYITVSSEKGKGSLFSVYLPLT